MMKNPRLASSREFSVNENDFVSPLHKTLFMVIYNLSIQGATEIKLGDVETYLANNDVVAHSRVFENGDGAEWITSILEDANESNYPYYHSMVRKYSYLRCKMEMGQDVSDILDLEEISTTVLEQQREAFERMTLNDIIRYFDSLNLQSKNTFMVRSAESSRKAGSDAWELYEQLKESPAYGYASESQYLDTVMRGLRRGAFLLESRDSGQGKTRVAIKRLLGISAPRYWSHKENKFIDNPNGSLPTLYLGTEMQLYEELEPMMWAFVSGVDEDKIREQKLTKEETERIHEAIKILEETPLFLEDEENYDIAFLWHIVERYKVQHGIVAVVIDYLELTGGLISEFVQMSRGMGVREDQILLNLSSNVKNMAKQFDVCMICFTQTTDEARRDGVRDQRSVKGARSLPNKCDLGISSFAPTKKELELIEPLIERKGLGNFTPNIVYTVYKNRGNRHKSIKIWAYQNLGTMEFVDLFCTDDQYRPINIDKTHISHKPKVFQSYNPITGEIIEEMGSNMFLNDDEFPFAHESKEVGF